MKECKLNYSLKKRPILAVGKEGKANNELHWPKGLAFDEPNQLIYIADWGNKRIQVVSMTGNFLKRFGQGILESPWGIAVIKDNVFVTDRSIHALFQFSKKGYKLVSRTGTKGGGEGQLENPQRTLYVAEENNNRVTVFSRDLYFLKHLGTPYLTSPCDAKVTSACVVVLDRSPNCVHFFSRGGALLRSCVTRRVDGIVYGLCLDTEGYILITDYMHDNINILSPSGQLIHVIGKEGHGRRELYYPSGICLSQTGTIFVVSENSAFGLLFLFEKSDRPEEGNFILIATVQILFK